MAKRSLFDQLDQAITAVLGRHPEPAPTQGEIARLLQIAADLRDLPREQFKARLKTELERSSSMATITEPAAAIRTSAAARLAFKDPAKAIEFYKTAFDAKETFRFENEFGIGHAEIMIGDSIVMICGEWPEGGRFSAETWGHSPVTMQISVPNADAFVDHAVSAGATLVHPVEDQFYGHREGALADPFGYTWGVSMVKEEMSLEEMHRRFRATAAPKVKTGGVDPVPQGYRTVTPYLVAQDADGLIEFVKKTFDAEEKFRAIGSAGGYHCEVQIGDSMMMIGGGGPKLAWRGDPIPMAFHIYVPDCDAVYERALQAGATSIAKPVDQVYGERSGAVKDAAGDYWYIATYKGKDYKWEGAPTVQPYLHPLRADPVIGFLKRAFDAQEIGRYATPDGVIHHVTMKIGDSHLEMGEAHGPYQPMPGMFYLYVPDCDALYRRALAAGATSISEPKDQPYGDRSGAVKDAFGNQWYIATHIKDMPAPEQP
jgi:PhnB protein